ncbi:hypothetical protein [Zobellia barbeyronii]|uniref:Uncharacterized protein n=1 Tax=Zobellia barbeyronii TaxID=2748009 RepID=A0ABS5WH29_9FLAO|nr:hypothetical protein [Zobellia barbeyronii]MBT2162470.1 hypothetical protein [Zobellia barbeyronii]
MASNSTETPNQVKKSKPTNSTDKLVEKLYLLKQKFQSSYYGNSDGRKYEKARNFNIRLSNILFEANQMATKLELIPSNSHLTINSEIQKLEKELNELI